MSSSVRTISRLAFSPRSLGPRSKYPDLSRESVVGTPFSSTLNKKNSHSGPTLNLYPSLAASSTAFLSIRLGSPSNGVPSVLYTSQISLATFPVCGLHGKITKLSRSGLRHISDSSIRANPSIDEPSNII